jgi:hypothetical protein
MTTRVGKSSPPIDISVMERGYVGRRIDLARFLKVFEPNGSDATNYRYYFSEDDDLQYFAAAYEEEDPRRMDYPPDDENDDDGYTDLPYPDLSLFAEIRTDESGNTTIERLGICKVYSTGCHTAGAHSNRLITAEAERIDALMLSVLA